MKFVSIGCLLVTCLLVTPNRVQSQEGAAAPVESHTGTKPYDGSWESLQTMPIPAWFDDGKIGIFIHWGPYSVMAHRKNDRGYAEHLPKLLYAEPDAYNPFLKSRFGATPPEFGYKDVVDSFRAEKWSPDQWAELFQTVGAKYVVMTAEHHDGWANWDSDLTPWNAVDKGPHRDLVGDLGESLKKVGLKYAPSYHRERHPGFFAKQIYAVHSEPRDMIVREMEASPESRMLYGPEFSYSKSFVDDYVARWKEIQTKYKPDFLWVDDVPIWTRDGNDIRKGKLRPEIQYFYDQCRVMITDFMNDAAKDGRDVYVNNKGGNRNWPTGVGCLEKDNLKLKVVGPKWQSCTTFGTSFGYLAAEEDPNYKWKKTDAEVIHELVEVVSRNGNFLINIGPKADGTIPPWQVEKLQAMGRWLDINGEAIYGSRYWKTSDQKDDHLAFTTKGKTLFAIQMQRPEAPFVIDGTKEWQADEVVSVRLLGSEADVVWAMSDDGLRITPPEDLGSSEHAWSFAIQTNSQQHHPNQIEKDEDKALQGTKAVDLEGRFRE
ncbi:alpha-L-fucosidase [Rhodopirellula sp. JC740]|uniref:alpha-L-fucosidase n=1 Tax=Rhodopirellula halodulae TaxID=2894198 RepID=A0ABS8NP75_9BACT|nr:alpha-L-fucosidase [Rhodopirellula sp. JC740]MCC9644593.1 alpha-L-fucosidase [Rhodopirellula sp. JC740]